MIVINGHVNAPADAALATSTPSRSPRFLVFHVCVGFCFEADIATCSETVLMLSVFCAIASRVIGVEIWGQDHRCIEEPNEGEVITNDSAIFLKPEINTARTRMDRARSGAGASDAGLSAG